MTRQREVVESPLVQGEDERIPYALNIEQWGTNPADITVVVKDEAGTDVSATVLTGSPTVLTETTIQLPTLHSLAAGSEYRMEIKFTLSGTTVLECYCYIRGEE